MNTGFWIAELEIRFENGSIGAKRFSASSKHLAQYDADYFLGEVIRYAKEKQKNLVASHRIHTFFEETV